MPDRHVQPEASGTALFNLGFRPFFLGAGIFAVVSVTLWTAVYVFGLPLPLDAITGFQWHAHEMIYGYTMAVIAGFLLTAIRNWTGIQTLCGSRLAWLFSLWAAARLFYMGGTMLVYAAAVFDMLFVVFLGLAITQPIVRAGQWKQMAVVSKVLTLGLGNLCFYLGYFGLLEHGVYWGLYGGLYLIVALVLTIGRRVVPSFIERGVGYPVQLSNSKWIDVLSLLAFVVFFIAEIFLRETDIAAFLALGLFILHSIRLGGWYTRGIWGTPLLWSLYLAIWFVTIGFLLIFLSALHVVPGIFAVHAFAFGGIGMVTMGMMARVSLGHTGRDVRDPPRAVSYALGLLLLGAITRVFAPIFEPDYYVAWIAVSQALWIGSFLLFVVIYAPLLVRPRVDEKFG